MYATLTLATRFAGNTFVIRSEAPLGEDQMRQAAPSIFAEGKHASRSERYTYIPAQGGFRALHGGAEQEPHRRQDRLYEAHDPHLLPASDYVPPARFVAGCACPRTGHSRPG